MLLYTTTILTTSLLFCQAAFTAHAAAAPSAPPSSSPSVPLDDEPSTTSTTNASRTTSVFKTIKNNPSMDIFEALCVFVGLKPLLNRQTKRERELVVFAPVEAAFKEFAQNDLEYLKLLLSNDQYQWHLDQFANNHIVASMVTSTTTTTTTTLTTDTVTQVTKTITSTDLVPMSVSVLLFNLTKTNSVSVIMRSGEILEIQNDTTTSNLALETEAASLGYNISTPHLIQTTSRDGILATNGIIYEIQSLLYPKWYYQDNVFELLHKETTTTTSSSDSFPSSLLPLLSTSMASSSPALSSNFSIFLSLIDKSHLRDEVLDLPMLTLIAPTNQAFETTLSESQMNYLSNNIDSLREVLAYHILPDVVVTHYTSYDKATTNETNDDANNDYYNKTYVQASMQGEDVGITLTASHEAAATTDNGKDFMLLTFQFEQAPAERMWLTKYGIVYQVGQLLLPPSLMLPPTRS